MLILFALLAAIAPPPAAPAVGTAPAAASAPAPVAVASDPMVCQMLEVTGSSFPKHTCLHRSQWAAREQGDQDSMQNAARLSTVSRSPGH